MNMVILTVPPERTGVVQTEYGNYTIEAGLVTVDSRVVLQLLHAGFTSTDLPDVNDLVGDITLEVPAGLEGIIQTPTGNYPIQEGLVTLPRLYTATLVSSGFSNPDDPTPPEGFAFVVDDEQKYVLDDNDSYVVMEI